MSSARNAKDTPTLYVWPGAFGLPTSSLFSLKAIYALRFREIPFKLRYVKATFPNWAERGTLPILERGDTRIEDSTNILREIDEWTEFPGPRLYPLNPELNLEVKLLEDWADEWLVLFVAYYRWIPNHNYDAFVNSAFAGLPSLIAKFAASKMRKSMAKALRARGLAFESEELRILRFREGLRALENRLERNAFLFGPSPTSADFAVAPHIKTALSNQLEELTRVIREFPKLMAWIESLDKYLSASE